MYKASHFKGMADHNGKPNAGEEGAAKEAKNQVRHSDKPWSKELVQEGRDNPDTFIDLQLWTSWGRVSRWFKDPRYG